MTNNNYLLNGKVLNKTITIKNQYIEFLML